MVELEGNKNFTCTKACDLDLRRKLPTGMHEIDKTLGGGLPTNGIVEICGESGSGKTQLCLQLSLTAQLQENGASVVYICTEDVFPSKRMQSLIKKHKKGNVDFGSNIFIEHAADLTAFFAVMKKISYLLKIKNIKLLVIDSIAALFRGVYNASEGLTRTQDMRQLGGYLLELNNVDSISIICVNQVTTCFSSQKNIAALGLSWTNIINTRIQLFRNHGRTRIMRVLFSPTLPQIELYFEITEDGLIDYCERHT